MLHPKLQQSPKDVADSSTMGHSLLRLWSGADPRKRPCVVEVNERTAQAH